MSKEETAKTVQDKIVDWMNGLEGVVSNNMDRVQEVTGQAVDLGLTVIQINAIQDILLGVLALVYLIWYVTYASSTLRVCVEESNKSPGEPENPLVVQKISISLAGLIPSILALITGTFLSAFNVWNWTAIFYPELYIAKQVTEKVLGI